MKLMIDIPDKIYETVQNGTYCGTLYEELKNGTPLSESEDCISRQAVLEVIEKCHCEEWVKADIGAPIEALQPVNSAEKVGHWIDDNKDEIDAQYGRHLYRCQICDKYAEYFVGGTEDWWDIEKPNYCPSCGARMGGEQNEID